MKKPRFSSAAVLAGILILLALATAYMLVRLYETSRLLDESDRKAFVLEAENKRVILGEYFRRRTREVSAFCNLKIFQTYFDAKVVGLSAGHGLEVLSSQIEQELLIRRLDTEEQGRTVYAAAAFFDIEDGKILARTDFSSKGKWINESLFASLQLKASSDIQFQSLCDGSACRAFVVGVVKNGNKAKGLLLMELAPEAIVGEVQLLRFQRIDDFAGLTDAQGTLFIGPGPLMARNIQDLFGVSPASLQDLRGKTLQATFPDGLHETVTVAGGDIGQTGFHLVQVTSHSKASGEHSPVLWTMVMVSLMGGLVITLLHISRTHADRKLMLRALSDARDHLEIRVNERTSELKSLNETLLHEIQERRRVEDALRRAGEYLEVRVVERTSELLSTNAQLQGEIQQRYKAEEALRHSEERFRALTETTSEWIWEMDVDVRFTYASPRLLELLGYMPEEILGRTPFDLMPPEEAERMRREFRAIVASGSPFKALENLNLHKDGSLIVLETSGLPFFDASGAIRGYRGIGRDITDRKRAEELLIQSERLKAVADLSAGVAHNFNNLLQIVLSSAEVAMKAADLKDSSPARFYIEQILDCCRFGAETVQRLENFAQGHSNLTAAEGRVFSLSATVRKAVQMTEPWWKTAPEREGVSIGLQAELSDDCFVRGEENELFEVIVNLIKNAAEALPLGGRLWVRVFSEKDGTILQVEDNGSGISEEIRGRLFQPFFTTKGPKGTGMGLASSYGIVVRHGGSISVDSKEGKGTKFTVRLPPVSAVQRISVLDAAEPLHALRILVVDDQALITASMEMMFQDQGHEVFTALSGQEGLEIFLREPLDVVVSDLSMPSMTGWQFAQAVKEASRDREVPKPAFIILTGWGTDLPEEERLEELGVDRIMRKPIRIRRLMAMVYEVVREQRSVKDSFDVSSSTGSGSL